MTMDCIKQTAPLHRRRILFALLLCLLLVFGLIQSANADMYIGRYEGNVIWSFDSTTGELRIYGDCGMQSPGWLALADNIRSVFIAPGTNRLPNDAFRSCNQLREIILPETVTTIGDYAFADCTALTALTLPASVLYIGNDAFRGCNSLSCITYTGTSEQWEQLCEHATANKSNEWLASQSPLYTRPTCRLTILYINEETGEHISPTVQRTLTLGAGCTIPSPEIKDFAPSDPAVVIQNAVADQTVTVRYHRTHCTVRVHYVNEKNKTILPSQEFLVAYGASLTLQAPEIPGYLSPDEPKAVVSSVTTDDSTHTFVYTTRLFSVTVRCLDENETMLCQPLTLHSIPYGGSYHIILPTINGHTTPTDYIEGANITEDIERTVYYTAIHYPITFLYVDEQGKSIAPSDVVSIRYGVAMTWTPREFAGFAAKEEQIYRASVSSAEHIVVVYERLRYLLTVRHEAQDGTLLDETQEYVVFEQPYACTPLSISGYTPEQQQPSNISGTMPASPLTVTIRYRPQVSSNAPSQDDTPQNENDASSKANPWLTVGIISGTVLLFVIIGWCWHFRNKTDKIESEQLSPPSFDENE